MIKNGRPYTNENGWEDARLLTNEDENTIKVVSEWIQNNIQKSRKILQSYTSYGLKHLLEDDTRVYLTNNQFKDAMMLAGYNPVDPSRLNWEYRIALKREINNNPSPFFKWAKRNAAGRCCPEGNFADDMLLDKDFPKVADHDVILEYLERLSACGAAIDAFESLWEAYERKAH